MWRWPLSLVPLTFVLLSYCDGFLPGAVHRSHSASWSVVHKTYRQKSWLLYCPASISLEAWHHLVFVKTLCCWLQLSVQFKMVSMRSEKHVHGALHHISQKFPQGCFWNGSAFVWLMMTLSCPFKEDHLACPLSFVHLGNLNWCLEPGAWSPLQWQDLVFLSRSITCMLNTEGHSRSLC